MRLQDIHKKMSVLIPKLYALSPDEAKLLGGMLKGVLGWVDYAADVCSAGEAQLNDDITVTPISIDDTTDYDLTPVGLDFDFVYDAIEYIASNVSCDRVLAYESMLGSGNELEDHINRILKYLYTYSNKSRGGSIMDIITKVW